MHARRVLGRLIDALLRREAAHQLGVAVAARAGRDLRLPGGLALEAARRVVRARLVAGRGVAAVAIDAREAALAMDVRLPRTARPAPRAARRSASRGTSGTCSAAGAGLRHCA